jgi:AcrR family transcriptional regulator
LLVSFNSHSTRSAEPRRRPRQQRSRELVARILDEAAHLFETLGYHDTTTNHVADAAGVSIGSLYQYFPNKDALLVGLAERHLDEAEPRLAALAEQLRQQQPSVGDLCRAFITEVADLNRSARLHHLLWNAPRTPALVERLARLDAALIADVAWHLGWLGHPAELAMLRARVLVTAIESSIHSIDPDEDQDEQIGELIRLATIYASAA